MEKVQLMVQAPLRRRASRVQFRGSGDMGTLYKIARKVVAISYGEFNKSGSGVRIVFEIYLNYERQKTICRMQNMN